jgi:hypothetical protein
MGTAHTTVRLRTLDWLVGTALQQYGLAGQTRTVTLTWLKSRNLVAEPAGAFAPEAGDRHLRLNRRYREAWRGSQVRDHIEAFDTDSAAGPRLRAAWRPQVVSVGFLDWRLSTAQAGSPC